MLIWTNIKHQVVFLVQRQLFWHKIWWGLTIIQGVHDSVFACKSSLPLLLFHELHHWLMLCLSISNKLYHLYFSLCDVITHHKTSIWSFHIAISFLFLLKQLKSKESKTQTNLYYITNSITRIEITKQTFKAKGSS